MRNTRVALVVLLTAVVALAAPVVFRARRRIVGRRPTTPVSRSSERYRLWLTNETPNEQAMATLTLVNLSPHSFGYADNCAGGRGLRIYLYDAEGHEAPKTALGRRLLDPEISVLGTGCSVIMTLHPHKTATKKLDLTKIYDLTLGGIFYATVEVDGTWHGGNKETLTTGAVRFPVALRPAVLP